MVLIAFTKYDNTTISSAFVAPDSSSGRLDVRGQRLPLGHADVIVGPGGHSGGGRSVAGGGGFPLALADRAVRRRFGPTVRVVLLQRPRRPLRRRRPQVRVTVRGRVLEQRGRVATGGRPDGRVRRRFGRRRQRRRGGQRDDCLRWRHWVQVVQPVGRNVAVVAAGRSVLSGEKQIIERIKITKPQF